MVPPSCTAVLLLCYKTYCQSQESCVWASLIPPHTPRPTKGGEGLARERARADRPHSSTGGGVSRGKGWVSVWGVVGVTPVL